MATVRFSAKNGDRVDEPFSKVTAGSQTMPNVLPFYKSPTSYWTHPLYMRRYSYNNSQAYLLRRMLSKAWAAGEK